MPTNDSSSGTVGRSIRFFYSDIFGIGAYGYTIRSPGQIAFGIYL